MRIIDCFSVVFNTLYFNCKVFGFSMKALKMPVIIGSNTKFGKLRKNGVIIDSPKFAAIKIGYRNGSFYRGNYLQNYINISEKSLVHFKGKANFAKGIVLNCSKNGVITFGNEVNTNYGCMISCSKEISFGNNVRGGWNCSIIDWDGHDIIDLTSKQIVNIQKGVEISDNCWLASNSIILKGVKLKERTIIPYGAIISKSAPKGNCIYGGQPNRVLKENIVRRDML